MFTKSIDATPGLTDFQIEYMQRHMNVPTTKAEKKGNVWGISILAVMTATTYGLWVYILQPETASDLLVNMTSFGVVVVILVHIIALFALVVAMVCVGGVDLVLAGLKAAAEEVTEEGRELALRTEAKRMMANRNSLVVYRPSWKKEVRVFFGRAVSLAFFVGMVANGYVFAPLVMAFVAISALCVSRLMRQRVIALVKPLTAEFVAELEAAHQRAEAETDKSEAIDVPSLPAPGPFKFRFEATDAAGTEVRETIEADNEDDAQQKIRQMGYFVTKIRRCRA
jgi:hypothetical protein